MSVSGVNAGEFVRMRVAADDAPPLQPHTSRRNLHQERQPTSFLFFSFNFLCFAEQLDQECFATDLAIASHYIQRLTNYYGGCQLTTSPLTQRDNRVVDRRDSQP